VSVAVVRDDAATSVAAGNDVLDCPGCFDAWLARHRVRVAEQAPERQMAPWDSSMPDDEP